MRIGSSIFLIALGAILAFAVDVSSVPYINLQLVGYILLALGVVGLIISLFLAAPRRQRRVTESRTAVDPATGERFSRNESREDPL